MFCYALCRFCFFISFITCTSYTQDSVQDYSVCFYKNCDHDLKQSKLIKNKVFENELDIVEKSFILIHTFHNVIDSTSDKNMYSPCPM